MSSAATPQPGVASLDATRKALFFGTAGAMGCLVGAMLGEPLFSLLPAAKPAVPQVDVLFVLDVTGSMQPQIDGVRAGIVDFATKLSDRGLDERVGAVVFRDEVLGEAPEVLDFGDGPFTRTYALFRERMSVLVASGGGDGPESSYDALRLACRQPFRGGATKVLVLITDAPPKLPDRVTRSAPEVVGELRERGIDQLHLVVDLADRPVYAAVQASSPGEVFDLTSVAGGGGNFDSLLPILGERIAEATVRGLASGSAVAVEYAPRQVLVTGLWTALLAAGVGLALVAGQNHYLHKPPFAGRQVPVAGILGLAVGAVSGGLAEAIGLAPQFVALHGESPDGGWLPPVLALAGSFVGWTLLGGLTGRGLAAFVPNLRPLAAVAGGVIGGVAGFLAFKLVSVLLGVAGSGLDVAGRLLGAAALGFCIGIMIAIAEAVARATFLEVRYGAREMIRVNLGAEPVTVGADRRLATVLVASAPRPVVFKYWCDEQGLQLLDYAVERTERIGPGDERTVGNVTITVRADRRPGIVPTTGTGGGSVPLPPPPPPPRRPGAPVAPPQIAPGPGTRAVPSAPPKPAAPAGERRIPPPPPPPPPPPRKP